MLDPCVTVKFGRTGMVNI